MQLRYTLADVAKNLVSFATLMQLGITSIPVNLPLWQGQQSTADISKNYSKILDFLKSLNALTDSANR